MVGFAFRICADFCLNDSNRTCIAPRKSWGFSANCWFACSVDRIAMMGPEFGLSLMA